MKQETRKKKESEGKEEGGEGGWRSSKCVEVVKLAGHKKGERERESEREGGEGERKRGR